MDDTTVKSVRDALDRELIAVGPNVGIAFGEDLMREFRKRGWIVLRRFEAVGMPIITAQLPAYGSHPVVMTWDIPESEYRVGRDA